MQETKLSKIHRKRLALAVASAITFVPMIAVAATPASTQLPGQGYVLAGTATGTYSAGASIGTVTVGSGNTIIQWGGTPYTNSVTASINSAGTAGFNIGASAGLTVENTGAGAASVLNIDATGNASQILGKLTATGTATAPTLFVANQNGGVVVGSGATIVAPTGIGFLNSAFNNNPTTGALADFVAGTADLVFTGATGGVNIEAGANLSGVSSVLLIAGAGTVNVNFAGITQPGGTTGGIPLIVDGGVGGTASVNATTYTPQSTGSIPTTGMTYGAPVQTTVNLNLGVTGNTYLTAAPYVFTAGSSVLAYGDVNIGSTAVIGDSTTSSSLPIEWTGTLTNSGIVNASGVPFGTATSVAVVNGSSSAYAPQGNFVNATGATFADYTTSDTAYTMAGSFTNNGTFTGVSLGEINAALGVVNTGTLNTGMAAGTFTAAAGTSGSVDLGGVLNFSTTTGGAFNLALTAGQNVTYGATVSFGTTGSYLGTATMDASSGAAVLASGLNLASSASITAGTNISLNAPLTVSNTTGTASVILSAGKLITVGSSAAISVTGSGSATNAVYVTATAGNGVDFGSSVTVANGGTGGTAINVALTNANAPTSFTLGSGATLSATSIALGDYTSGTTTSAVSTAYQIGGSVTASSVTFGLNSAGGQLVTDQVNSVTGAGTITANSVTFNNVTGNINNRVGANPLSNGFNLAAASTTSPMAVAWTLDGNSAQAVNLNIAGAANLTGGNATGLLVNQGSGTTVGAQVVPNAGSSLLVQASGIINLAGGSNGGVAGFTFPGGVAFVSKTGITQNAALYNGWSMNPVAFQGVFFDAPSISVNGSIYTNANSYVNFSVAPNVLPSIYQVSQNQYTGNFSYTPTSVAIHQNSYTTIANTAATGGNWVAQVNTTPITSLSQFK